MGDRFPGGVISKTPPTVVAPVDGEGGSASGVWTLAEQLGLQKAGVWPQKVLPRELYAWGDNSPNGQLGLGNVVDRSSPVQVGALTNWAQVAAGGSFTACVTTAGTLFTWGRNTNGQLGQSNVIARSSPVQVGALTNWAQASTGSDHTACVTTAGTLFTWGSNANGRLGDGTVIARSSPVQVGALTTWRQVSVSQQGTFAVTTANTLFGWGANGSGEVGDSTTIERSSPVQIGALTNWSQVSAGTSTHFAIKTDGTLWAWGASGSGALGDNSAINKSSPVQIGALTNWVVVAGRVAGGHAITTAGALWGWGRNQESGEIGINLGGIGSNRSSPVQVGAGLTWSKLSQGESAAGRSAIKTDGTLWAWGANDFGQLGDGTTVTKSSPVQVGAGEFWEKAALAGNHALAITKG
jgi:alpha-tubulin suppressor-like RCC1 family protein